MTDDFNLSISFNEGKEWKEVICSHDASVELPKPKAKIESIENGVYRFSIIEVGHKVVMEALLSENEWLKEYKVGDKFDYQID